MRLLYFLLTFPILLIGEAFLVLGVFQLRKNLNSCILAVDVNGKEVPEKVVPYLVVAEDHRSSHHFGVDHIAIVRALFLWMSNSGIQGASTIEQQFVRVVTGDYSHSLVRKFREQLLAVSLTMRRPKADIAKAYLAIAYYGSDSGGLKGIRSLDGKGLMLASEDQIASIIARLKYPPDSASSILRVEQLNRRITHIKKKYQAAVNDAGRNTSPRL